MWYILLLACGFVPLIYGANLLIDNASSFAKRLNIPNIVIGLTIVAFGTSAPELVVNIFAAVEKGSDIALGNVTGSNMFNILIMLGVSAMVYPLVVKKSTTWIEIPLCLLSAIVLILMANDRIIDHAKHSVISRIDGAILLIFFIIFMVYNILLAKKESFTEKFPVQTKSLFRSILLIVAGLVLLAAGGRLIVMSAVKVAEFIGMTQRIIAITIVSVGTSLPELATSIVAARKRNTDIVIGNIVGSNIFNVFLILGTSAVIYPISVNPLSNFDMLFNITISLLLFIFIFTGRGRRIDWWEGMLFVILYIVYLVYILFF